MTIPHTKRTDRRAKGSLSGSSVEYNQGWNCYNHGKSLPSGCSRSFRSGYNAAMISDRKFKCAIDEARTSQNALIRRLAKEALERDGMPATKFNINRYIHAARVHVQQANLH